jgi:hypothetical protein
LWCQVGWTGTYPTANIYPATSGFCPIATPNCPSSWLGSYTRCSFFQKATGLILAHWDQHYQTIGQLAGYQMGTCHFANLWYCRHSERGMTCLCLADRLGTCGNCLATIGWVSNHHYGWETNHSSK